MCGLLEQEQDPPAVFTLMLVVLVAHLHKKLVHFPGALSLDILGWLEPAMTGRSEDGGGDADGLEASTELFEDMADVHDRVVAFLTARMSGSPLPDGEADAFAADINALRTRVCDFVGMTGR